MGKELNEMLSGIEQSGDDGSQGADNQQSAVTTAGTNDTGTPAPASQAQGTPASEENNNSGASGSGEGTPPDPAAASQEPEVNIDYINRAIDGKYTSIDEVKSRLAQLDELESLRTREQQNVELIERANDPRSFFANDTLFKHNEIKKQNPEISTFVINQLLDVENVNEMEPLQALVLKHVMDVPSHQRSINDVRELINEKYGLNVNLNNIEDEDERAIAEKKLKFSKLDLEADAERAKKEFTNIIDIKLPEKTDIEQLRADRQREREEGVTKSKTSFQPIVEGMAKNFNNVELKYPDGDLAIDFNISEQERQVLSQGMLDAAVKMGLNPGNIDDVKKLGNYARNFVIANNLSKILKAHEENIVAKMKDGEYKRHHVVNPGDPGAGPASQTHAETNDDIIRREIKGRKNTK